MLSIIIPCKNHFDVTQNLLQSIPANTHYEYEIILIDDGSTDQTKQLHQDDLGIDKLIRHTTNLGMPKSINDAVEVAEGKYLAIFNNDMIVGDWWDEPLVRTLKEQEDIGMVSSFCAYNYNEFIQRMNTSSSSQSIKVWDMALPYFLPAKIQKELGPWDERFFPSYYDDVDIRVRLCLLGYKFAMVEESICLHISNTTVGDGSMPKDFTIESTKKFGEKWKLPESNVYVYIDYSKLYNYKILELCTPEKYARNITTI